jgi:phosphatidylglycerol:prolipoprotein diacylglycerol transferase
MLVLAFLAAATLAAQRAKQEGVDPEIIFNLCFLALVFGILGARLLYVLQYAGYYLKNPLEIIMLQYGGLSWFGGLAAGAAAAVIYLKIRHLSVYKILDLVIPFVALAQAIGRIGCLLNGCCYGRGPYLIPTQIYSSLALLVIFFILRHLQERPHRAGEIFFTYLALYALKRFFIEFWRADNEIIFLGLTLFQVFSLIIFTLAFLKLLALKIKKN